MSASTARNDVRAGLYSFLTTLKAANTAMFAGDVHRVRPGSLVPPCAYVGNLNEVIDQDAQTRTRLFNAEVVLVQRLISPGETADAMDDMVDKYVDHVTDNPHLGGGIIEPVSVRDVELDLGGTLYSASVVGHRVSIMEGRL